MSTTTQPWLKLDYQTGFADWLSIQHCSLAVSTYQTGKLLLLGANSDGKSCRIRVFERNFKHCMGMAERQGSLWIATRYQIWRLEPAPLSITQHAYGINQEQEVSEDKLPGWATKGYDVAFVPRVGYTTGYIDTHDIAVNDEGRVFFVSTMFSCVANLSEKASFLPYWRPKFISQLAPEDRCHLNGLAIRDNVPRYVSCASLTDSQEGWRSCRKNAGAIIDMVSNDVVCEGLSMPHSPRWHLECLWFHNSGTGEFGKVDLDRGKFEPILFCPGYLRGLSFCGDYAIASLSKPRNKTFSGLDMDHSLESRKASSWCGLVVINLRNGIVEHELRFESDLLTEVYDVCVLPQARQPMAVGFQNDEIEKLVLIEDSQK